MTVLEDVAKKYCEEILPFAPVSCVCSFFVGIALNHASVGAIGESAWWRLLDGKFEDYWYFLDVLKKEKVIVVVMSAIFSFFGYVFFRHCSKVFMSIGIKSQVDQLQGMYSNALRQAMSCALSEKSSSIAERWYSRFEKKILGSYKLGVFISGLLAETILVLLSHFTLIDVFFGLLLLAMTVALAFWFGLVYYKAVLPRKILLDASLGMIKLESLTDLDGID